MSDGSKLQSSVNSMRKASFSTKPGILQRKCDKCHKKLYLQRRSSVQAKPTKARAIPPMVHEVLRSPSQPLDTATRSFFEPRFGHDFSQIPVHYKSPANIQAKLRVSSPGDIYEQEAARISDQVMATPEHTAVSGIPPRIQRFSGQSNGQMDAVPASVDRVLASPGRPLEPTLRHDMEQRFGHDFSRVRVHSGAVAEQSAWEVNAHAYTVGHNIVFGTGRFAPGTYEGRRLIAHELTHVVQQTGTDQVHVGQCNEKRGQSPISDASHTEVSLAKMADDEPDSQMSATQSSVHGGIPFYINPDVFDFAPDPSTANWQTTGCVSIVFGYGSPFLPMMRLEVGVNVGAPLILRDGRKLSVREAQLDSANAAQAAAEIIKIMLDSHTIGPSEVQPRFVGFMFGAIVSTGLGYRVIGCRPKPQKMGAGDVVDF